MQRKNAPEASLFVRPQRNTSGELMIRDNQTSMLRPETILKTFKCPLRVKTADPFKAFPHGEQTQLQ
ncbi:hypothetical protein [Ochrobactrum sp. SFR4]|uniref:hypothetical protein n=1 Tax=Ochrobactrum sp. SFR4 TaxID=2717368 RepID=UPI001C8C37DD|nr:hypothetical protein [Ochrobactrum sp. SFR4]